MSKVWKWILGVLIVLVVIAVVAGAVFVWRNHASFAGARRVTQLGPRGYPPNGPRGQNPPTAPNSPKGQLPGWNGPNTMRGWNFREPMRYGRGGRGFGLFGMLMPFGIGLLFLGGLFRLIIPLGVLALVAFVFYQMGKRAGVASASRTSAPTGPSQSEPSEPPKRGRKVAKS